MATPLIQQTNIINDKCKSKSKQTTTTTANIAPTEKKSLPQRQSHHLHYPHRSKDNDNNGDVEDVGYGVCMGDFYHIKQCYHSLTTAQRTRTRTRTRTKIGTLSQRESNNYPNTTTVTYTTTTTTTTITTATSSKLSHVLHSLSYNCRSFLTMLLMGCLLLFQYTMAAPQSCILCDKNDLLAKDPQTNYEEFLFEHQVTRQDAINALRQLNDSFYEGAESDSSCNAVRCTEKVMKYCLGPQFINDHCWCELGHSTEGLPFVPHICYVGEKVYKTSVGSCFFYEEVKECCCSSVLAKEWRHISAGSTVYSKILFHEYYKLVIISFIYFLIKRSYN